MNDHQMGSRSVSSEQEMSASRLDCSDSVRYTPTNPTDDTDFLDDTVAPAISQGAFSDSNRSSSSSSPQYGESVSDVDGENTTMLFKNDEGLHLDDCDDGDKFFDEMEDETSSPIAQKTQPDYESLAVFDSNVQEEIVDANHSCHYVPKVTETCHADLGSHNSETSCKTWNTPVECMKVVFPEESTVSVEHHDFQDCDLPSTVLPVKDKRCFAKVQFSLCSGRDLATDGAEISNQEELGSEVPAGKRDDGFCAQKEYDNENSSRVLTDDDSLGKHGKLISMDCCLYVTVYSIIMHDHAHAYRHTKMHIYTLLIRYIDNVLVNRCLYIYLYFSIQ